MRTLDELRLELVESYTERMVDAGPMHVFMKDCATGYIHSFNIRALCSEYLLSGNTRCLEACKRWAHLSIRLQGTYGEPGAYNMGYLFESPGNVPKSWFCADTFDQGFALLNVAAILDPSDPLYIQILESILRYDSYIQRWNLGKNGFALGYMDGEEPPGCYHTAVARGICFYSSMLNVFHKSIYRERARTLLEYLLEKIDFNSNYHGSPLHNRCYAADALYFGYYLIAKPEDYKFKECIVNKISGEFLPWAIKNQTPAGYWPHDRLGYQPGTCKPTVDTSIVGPYSWGMVEGFQLFANELLRDNTELTGLLERAFSWLLPHAVPGNCDRWGYHGWAMLAILAKEHPETLFPFWQNDYPHFSDRRKNPGSRQQNQSF